MNGHEQMSRHIGLSKRQQRILSKIYYTSIICGLALLYFADQFWYLFGIDALVFRAVGFSTVVLSLLFLFLDWRAAWVSRKLATAQRMSDGQLYILTIIFLASIARLVSVNLLDFSGKELSDLIRKALDYIYFVSVILLVFGLFLYYFIGRVVLFHKELEDEREKEIEKNALLYTCTILLIWASIYGGFEKISGRDIHFSELNSNILNFLIPLYFGQLLYHEWRCRPR